MCKTVPWQQDTYEIDPMHKSHNAPMPYPTMLHSEQKCAHFCSEWSIVGYGTGARWWDIWLSLCRFQLPTLPLHGSYVPCTQIINHFIDWAIAPSRKKFSLDDTLCEMEAIFKQQWFEGVKESVLGIQWLLWCLYDVMWVEKQTLTTQNPIPLETRHSKNDSTLGRPRSENVNIVNK